MLPEVVWEAVLLRALPMANGRLALGRLPELALVVSLCNLNSPRMVSVSLFPLEKTS